MARSKGWEPTAWAVAGREHRVVLAALQIDPSMIETVALDLVVT